MWASPRIRRGNRFAPKRLTSSFASFERIRLRNLVVDAERRSQFTHTQRHLPLRVAYSSRSASAAQSAQPLLLTNVTAYPSSPSASAALTILGQVDNWPAVTMQTRWDLMALATLQTATRHWLPLLTQ